MLSNKWKLALVSVLVLPSICNAAPIYLTTGWNLVGNGDAASVDVASLLGDKSKITSAWKWNKDKNIWAFYAPSMDATSLASYAASKGYEVLSTILPKEGYWVNSLYVGSLNDSTAAPPVVGSAFPSLLESDLNVGWNLVASADNMNPSQLNTTLRTTLGSAGKSITTAWTWDSAAAKWRFYATTLEAQGGTVLADYIQSKNYLPFSTAPSASQGYWMNIGVGSPSASSPTLALEYAKSFMDTLRSNLKALGAADISLQTELQATADDLRMRVAPLATNNINSLRAIHDAVIFWNDVVKNPNRQFSSTLELYTSSNSYAGMFPSGGCTLYLDPNYTTVALAKDEAKYIACGISDYFVDAIPATDANGETKSCSVPGEWCNTRWSARIRINPDPMDDNKFRIYTQTRESVFTLPAITGDPYVETRTNYGDPFPGNAATLLTKRDVNGVINGVKLQGDLSPGYQIATNWSSSYDPVLAIWNSKPNAVVTLYGDKHKVSLDAALTHPSTGIDRYAVTGSAEVIKNGASETQLNLLDGSYLQTSTSSVASVSAGQALAQDGSHEVLLKLSGGSTSSQVSGNIKFGSFTADASRTRYQPTLFEFSGAIARNNNTFFSGSISAENRNYAHFNETLPANDSNYTSIHASYAGTINVPTRLPLMVSLVSNIVKAGNSSASTFDASGQYSQGALLINLSAYDKLNVRMVTLQSTDGVQIIIDPSKTSYPITNNSALQGVYDASTSQINYIDGSYTIH